MKTASKSKRHGKQFATCITPELLARMREFAKRDRRPFATIVTMAFEEFLEKRKDTLDKS